MDDNSHELKQLLEIIARIAVQTQPLDEFPDFCFLRRPFSGVEPPAAEGASPAPFKPAGALSGSVGAGCGLISGKAG